MVNKYIDAQLVNSININLLAGLNVPLWISYLSRNKKITDYFIINNVAQENW